MVKKKIISVIIPSWNTKELLRQCLKSIYNLPLTINNCEVIVVDNGSTDGSPEMVEKEFHRVLLIKNKKNLGYGAANNQALRQVSTPSSTRGAQGKVIMLLNSDTIVKNKAPEKMAEFLDKHSEAGVVGCKLLNADGTDQPSFGPFPNLFIVAVMLFAEHWFGDLVRKTGNKIQETDWVMGAALMVKKEVFEKVGPMDEGFFMYMDEVEWCYRIKKAGWRVVFYPEVEIIHHGRASSTTGRKDPILNIYRGLIHFYKKHYPPWQLPILRLMLKLKAISSLLVGYLTNNQYLKETYAQALKIA